MNLAPGQRSRQLDRSGSWTRYGQGGRFSLEQTSKNQQHSARLGQLILGKGCWRGDESRNPGVEGAAAEKGPERGRADLSCPSTV